MAETPSAVRQHLIKLLDWGEAHATFDAAVANLAADKRGARAPGFEHSPWELLEHLRMAQDDLLDFCRNPNYHHALTWPDDYWPRNPAPPSEQAWTESIASFVHSREAVKAVVRDVPDLGALVPTGQDGQTYLRSVLLVADHAAYHVGQIVAVRRALGVWP